MTNIEVIQQAIKLDKKLDQLDSKVDKLRKEFNLIQGERDKLRLSGELFNIWNPSVMNKFVKIGNKLYNITTTQQGSFATQEVKIEKL